MISFWFQSQKLKSAFSEFQELLGFKKPLTCVKGFGDLCILDIKSRCKWEKLFQSARKLLTAAVKYLCKDGKLCREREEPVWPGSCADADADSEADDCEPRRRRCYDSYILNILNTFCPWRRAVCSGFTLIYSQYQHVNINIDISIWQYLNPLLLEKSYLFRFATDLSSSSIVNSITLLMIVNDH